MPKDEPTTEMIQRLEAGHDARCVDGCFDLRVAARLRTLEAENARLIAANDALENELVRAMEAELDAAD